MRTAVSGVRHGQCEDEHVEQQNSGRLQVTPNGPCSVSALLLRALALFALCGLLSCGDEGSMDPDPTPPATPTGLVSTALSDSVVSLVWTDASDDEEGFKVFQNTGSAKAGSLIATLPADTENYEDAGLQGATTYYYRVFSFSSAGDSKGSSADTATTFITPPSERFFPVDFLDTYQLVRDCRFSVSHPLQISVYVNPEAADAYLQGIYPFEEGTVCVKTVSIDFDCRQIREYVTMLKGPPGAAPPSGDWWWQVVSSDMTIDSTGVLASCLGDVHGKNGCHATCEITDWACTEP